MATITLLDTAKGMAQGGEYAVFDTAFRLENSLSEQDLDRCSLVAKWLFGSIQAEPIYNTFSPSDYFNSTEQTLISSSLIGHAFDEKLVAKCIFVAKAVLNNPEKTCSLSIQTEDSQAITQRFAHFNAAMNGAEKFIQLNQRDPISMLFTIRPIN